MQFHDEDLGRGYLLTTDKSRMQPRSIHAWLSGHSYWAPGIPPATFQTSFEHSLCFGILLEGEQVGFARLVTDFAVFAYLADVYVLPEHRGQGLSKKMMAYIAGLPFLAGCRRIMLATKDAHGLYAQFGFHPVAHPERLMEIVRTADIYQPATTPG